MKDSLSSRSIWSTHGPICVVLFSPFLPYSYHLPLLHCKVSHLFPLGILDKSLECSGHKFYLLLTLILSSFHFSYHFYELSQFVTSCHRDQWSIRLYSSFDFNQACGVPLDFSQDSNLPDCGLWSYAFFVFPILSNKVIVIGGGML